MGPHTVSRFVLAFLLVLLAVDFGCSEKTPTKSGVAPDIEETVQARVEATIVSLSISTVIPSPTATTMSIVSPTPMAAATPTPVPVSPTASPVSPATPTPTVTPRLPTLTPAPIVASTEPTANPELYRPTPDPMRFTCTSTNSVPVPVRGDTTPPKFEKVAFAPSVVNVGNRDEDIVFTVHVTDDLSGLQRMQLTFESPSRMQSHRVRFGSIDANPIHCTDGVYGGVLRLPRFSESGTWRLSWANLTDRVGNAREYSYDEFLLRGFPASFNVVYEE